MLRTAAAIALVLASAATRAETARAQQSNFPIQAGEVVARMKTQPVEDYTLEAFNMSNDFLRRVGDRVIRMEYQRRFRAVAGTAAAANSVGVSRGGEATSRSGPLLAAGGSIVVIIAVAAIVRRRRKRT